MRRFFLPSLLAASACVFAPDALAQQMVHRPDTTGFSGIVQPFLKDNCVRCHGPEKQKGKLRLDTLAPNFLDPLALQKWREVVDAVNAHEMPPEDEKQPEAKATGKFAEWLEMEIGHAEIAQRSTRVVLRRLNRAEYDNTIRDLVGVDFSPAEKFPEDPPAGGFDNIGAALTISPMQIELYYAAAREILRSIRSAWRWKISTHAASGATAKGTASRGGFRKTTRSSTPARRCRTGRSSAAWRGSRRSF